MYSRNPYRNRRTAKSITREHEMSNFVSVEGGSYLPYRAIRDAMKPVPHGKVKVYTKEEIAALEKQLQSLQPKP